MEEEITLKSVHKDLQDLAYAVSQGFEKMGEDFSILKSDVSILKMDVSTLKADVSKLKSDMTHVQAEMVTKDYLDKKMAEQKGEMISLIRKEDTKLGALVDTLADKEVLKKADVKKIMSMEPFARPA